MISNEKHLHNKRNKKKLLSSLRCHLVWYLINIIQAFKNPTSFGLTYSPVTIRATSPSIKSLTHPLKSLIQSSTQISL